MPDQAEELRARVRAGGPMRPVEAPARRCRTIVVAAGKGGVGASVLALNLAVALGERRQRVMLIDADLGAANIDLLAGLAPRFDLGDVLAGDCSLAGAAVVGPGNVRVVAGAHAARLPGGRLAQVGERLRAEVAALRDDPDAGVDILLIDAGTGPRSAASHLASLADEVIVVAGPEPTAILDTHAALARLGRLPPSPTVRVVVNRARSRAEGRGVVARLVPSARQFQGLVVDPLGIVRADARVGRAVRLGRPVVGAGWPGRAARDLRRLAVALLGRSGPGESTARAGRPEGAVEAAPTGRSRWGRVAAI